MTYHTHRTTLPLIVCSIWIAGCGVHLKDAAGRRLSLADYDRVSLKSVESTRDINRPEVPEDLAEKIRTRLAESKSWNEPASPDDEVIRDPDSSRQIDITVTILKARHPSRSKTIWLGAAHKMTCRLEVRDQAAVLGRAKIACKVEPLMGNAALLNGGTLGILGRVAFDTRKHDAASLLDRMAREIVKTLDRAKEEHAPSR